MYTDGLWDPSINAIKMFKTPLTFICIFLVFVLLGYNIVRIIKNIKNGIKYKESGLSKFMFVIFNIIKILVLLYLEYIVIYNLYYIVTY